MRINKDRMKKMSYVEIAAEILKKDRSSRSMEMFKRRFKEVTGNDFILNKKTFPLLKEYVEIKKMVASYSERVWDNPNKGTQCYMSRKFINRALRRHRQRRQKFESSRKRGRVE